MVITRNDDAVSPVIGTILMVAVTVILAAVIASFVFGSAGNVSKTKIVAATAQMTTTGEIYITYQGGLNDDSVTSLNVTAPNGSTWHITDSEGSLANSGTTYAKPKVGAIMKLYPADWPTGQKHVAVVASFNDGASQVILDTFV